MPPSATCSEARPDAPRGAIPPAVVGSFLLLVLATGSLGPAAPGLPAQVRMTQPEALASVFVDTAAVERRTAYLDSAQLARAGELAGSSVEVDQPVVTHYVGPSREGGPVVAYFDAHRVRTKPEVLMIVVGPDDGVRRVEVLKFMEPREYFPPEGWLGQFPGRGLDPSLSTRGEIAGITGATLTARAVTRAVRRVLALHRVIDPFGSSGAETSGRRQAAPGGIP